MEKFKVVIADDHPIVLLGVRELMERESNFEIVGEAISSQGLIEILEQQPVDIVITDYNMPGDSPTVTASSWSSTSSATSRACRY